MISEKLEEFWTKGIKIISLSSLRMKNHCDWSGKTWLQAVTNVSPSNITNHIADKFQSAQDTQILI